MTVRRFPAAIERIGPPRGGIAGEADLLQSCLARDPHPSDFIMEVPTMSRAKQASKPRSRAKAVTVLGVAGALSLAGSASWATVDPAGDTETGNTAPVFTLDNEEISDVSLGTFYVFDNENAGAHSPGLQLVKAHGRRGRAGCAVNRGSVGCAVACGGCGGCGGGGGAPTGSGGPDGM
jgi:hypothetical protein